MTLRTVNRGTVITRARQIIAEPLNRFITTTELQEWLNDEMEFLSQKLLCFKRTKTYSVTASSDNGYISGLGTNPYYFMLPSDFIALDRNAGLQVNGIRRLPSNDDEYYAMQQKAVAEFSDDSTAVISASDFYTESFTGILLHYCIDHEFASEIESGRTGKLMFMTPNPASGSSITLRYAAIHPVLASDAASLFINHAFSELAVLGTAKRAMMKKQMSGIGRLENKQLIDREYDKLFIDAKDHYDEINKVPDKQPIIRSAKQMYGLYDSKIRNRHGRNVYSSEW